MMNPSAAGHFAFAVLITAGMLGCGQPLDGRDKPRSAPPGSARPMPLPPASAEAPAKAGTEPSPPPAQPAASSRAASSETVAPAVASSEQRPAPPPLAMVEGDRIATAKPIVFKPNDTIALPESAPVLDAVADLLRQNPALRIEIRVHIDKGDDMGYGRSPSQYRARRVMDYLVRRGIDPDRLAAKGYGATQPLTRGKTPAERAQNRRTELVVQGSH